MYGEMQLVQTMGGGGGGENVANTEEMFGSPSSSSQLQNPNFNFIPFDPFSSVIPEENGMLLKMMMMVGSSSGKEEMMESGSGSDPTTSMNNEHDDVTTSHLHDHQPPSKKKKHYHRHTALQIHEMESLFKECPHPDDKQRMRLSQELGLTPRQVKFWFQNRRTQMKAQQDRTENVMLRAENENLKAQNYRLQAELSGLSCPSCGGLSFHELHLENSRLRDQLDRLCCIVSRYSGRPIQSMSQAQPLMNHLPPQPPHPPHPLQQPSLDLDMSVYHGNFPEQSCTDMAMLPPPDTATCFFPESNGLLLAEDEKAIAVELAVSCVQELVKMCKTDEPLWTKRRPDQSGDESVSLNAEEYARLFPWPLEHSKGGLKREGSRATTVVIMNSVTLVNAFLDSEKWADMFCSIVARAKTVQIISAGPSGASGSLVLMYAELQVLSPLVPTREAYFLRYVEQNAEEGTWAVVDFPIDSFHDRIQPVTPLYRRKPSGCLIQDMPNGYSRVTWVEHAEVEEKHVHETLREYLKSGMAFGAHRWLAVLQRQCERIASLLARNITDLGVIPSPESRKNLMKLAQRMLRTFCVSISTSYGQSWTALSESAQDSVRITTRKLSEPGHPTGVVLCAVSTTCLPYSHIHVFDLLRDVNHRSQLEVMFNATSLHEVAHIANGSNPGNCISLLRVNVTSNSSHNVELVLQESCTDQSGSLVVYSTVDVDAVQLAMSGEDPSSIPILPLGFSVVPVPDEGISLDPSKADANANAPSCLLTVAIQVLASSVPTAKLNLSTVTAINNHLSSTVNRISTALSRSSANTAGDCLVAASAPEQGEMNHQ